MKTDRISTVASPYRQLKIGKVRDEGRYLYTATGAVGKISSCVNSRFPDEVMFTVIEAQGDVEGDAQEMKKLINDYSKNVEKSSECS